MPVISREKTGFQGATGYREFVRITKVDSQGVFTCNLPDEVCVGLGIDNITGRTKDDVDKGYHQALKDFKAINTVRQKVIVYSIKINCNFTDGKSGGWVLYDDIHFAKGTGLTIGYQVLQEEATTKPDGNVVYRYHYYWQDGEVDHQHVTDVERVDDFRVGRARHWMEWTKEREAFFKNSIELLERLILQCHTLIKNEKGLADMIDAGRLLAAGKAGDQE